MFLLCRFRVTARNPGATSSSYTVVTIQVLNINDQQPEITVDYLYTDLLAEDSQPVSQWWPSRPFSIPTLIVPPTEKGDTVLHFVDPGLMTKTYCTIFGTEIPNFEPEKKTLSMWLNGVRSACHNMKPEVKGYFDPTWLWFLLWVWILLPYQAYLIHSQSWARVWVLPTTTVCKVKSLLKILLINFVMVSIMYYLIFSASEHHSIIYWWSWSSSGQW